MLKRIAGHGALDNLVGGYHAADALTHGRKPTDPILHGRAVASAPLNAGGQHVRLYARFLQLRFDTRFELG